MKKNLVFLFLFISMLTNAQNFTISGKIVGKNQGALNRAHVIVEETQKVISSDKNGTFQLNLTNGNYTLFIAHIGFKSIQKKITLTKNKELTIVLLPETKKQPSTSHQDQDHDQDSLKNNSDS